MELQAGMQRLVRSLQTASTPRHLHCQVRTQLSSRLFPRQTRLRTRRATSRCGTRLQCISSVIPVSFASGAFTLTVTGSKFASGAQVLFGGSALTTTYVSSTQLTAKGTEPTAGMYAVSVSNPSPGSSTSGVINVTVTSSSGGNPPPNACSVVSLGEGGSLNGFLPFPADNAWNQNICERAGGSQFRGHHQFHRAKRSGPSGLRLG